MIIKYFERDAVAKTRFLSTIQGKSPSNKYWKLYYVHGVKLWLFKTWKIFFEKSSVFMSWCSSWIEKVLHFSL